MTYEFHSGELELQKRMGVRETADHVVRGIHASVPAAAGAFLEQRRFVVLAATDADHRPWASLLAGPAGFARCLDEHTIRIDAVPPPGDPLAANLRTNALAGIIAPDLATRRRLRINGRLEIRDGAILIHVDQAYSNCPKYIQLRKPDGKTAPTLPRLVGRSSSLLPRQREWIRSADTFFIATLVPGEGADASHRGGMPGFVEVDGQELSWPDYPGNAMFNSLGNILKNPRAGILVPDFATGSILQMTGRASLDSARAQSAERTGEELSVRFTAEAVVEIEGVLPQRLRLVEYSPFNPVVSTR
jgi:uncharacterized protein